MIAEGDLAPEQVEEYVESLQKFDSVNHRQYEKFKNE